MLKIKTLSFDQIPVFHAKFRYWSIIIIIIIMRKSVVHLLHRIEHIGAL